TTLFRSVLGVGRQPGNGPCGVAAGQGELADVVHGFESVDRCRVMRRLDQHQVVAVDYGAAVAVAEDALDLARVAAGDAPDVGGRVLADTARHAPDAGVLAQHHLDHVA